MKKKIYKVKGEVWLWPGDTPWHFVNVGKKQSEEISKLYGKKRRGFGSLPVLVTVGKTSWKTSIFPEKKSGTYLLPLKVDVRKKESITDGDTITFSLEIHV